MNFRFGFSLVLKFTSIIIDFTLRPKYSTKTLIQSLADVVKSGNHDYFIIRKSLYLTCGYKFMHCLTSRASSDAIRQLFSSDVIVKKLGSSVSV